jgi:myb proto-oncogene protein
LDVEFDNGEKYSYSAEFLRVHSPAANSSRKSASGEVKVSKSRFSLSLQIQMPLSNNPNGFLLTTNHCCFLLCFQHWCQVVSGRRHVAIMSVEPVGNYGIRLAFVGKMLVLFDPYVIYTRDSELLTLLVWENRIAFDDLHNTGIYTWNFLHSLGELKFHRMRQYLQALKHQGLSRDPPRKK